MIARVPCKEHAFLDPTFALSRSSYCFLTTSKYERYVSSPSPVNKDEQVPPAQLWFSDVLHSLDQITRDESTVHDSPCRTFLPGTSENIMYIAYITLYCIIMHQGRKPVPAQLDMTSTVPESTVPGCMNCPRQTDMQHIILRSLANCK